MEKSFSPIVSKNLSGAPLKGHQLRPLYMMGLEIILEIAIPFDILEELLVCKISEN
jgi:hypothetical protein